MFSFFTGLVNVEEGFHEAEKFLKQKQYAAAQNVLQKAGKFIGSLNENHVLSLHPNEQAVLGKVLKDIARAEAAAREQSASSMTAVTKARENLGEMFKLSSVYLLRHPEKPKKGVDTLPNLSSQGVRQAKRFAEYLGEEILLCPKPVRVVLQCSDLRRAWLFAEVIRRKLQQLVHHYHKNVTFSVVTQHPALYFRFTKDNVAVLEVDYAKNEFEAFSKWVNNKYPNFPKATKVAQEVESWARQGTGQSSDQEWTVVVGVSHSFIIDTLLYFTTSEHSSIIPTANYARFVGREMGYLGKWYAF